MNARLAALPNRQPKDSPAYRRWYAARAEGVRQWTRPNYPPRPCVVDGVVYVPHFRHQKRCPACIAANRWSAA